jgi:putative glutamine amidotransferase
LVLAGGGDIDPRLYGARAHETNYMIDPARDRFEIRLVEHALSSGMPVLAICRGMQILNVALGGDLVAHVPERWGEGILHRAPPRVPVTHDVEIEPGSRLFRILGEARIPVVSWHHQAVDRMGDGLRIVAHSDDGLPEAVEMAGAAWVLGVQWHPELDAHISPPQAALFRAVVRAAESYTRSET